ncbi:hypothetical protein ACEYYB_13340 [Paracoccus sp. p4-l81]|uniref:hypothetical protein n=1 Tax=Paracoccus sp. p4-l81 TaxID=3342806 RepID=UPI0035B8DAA5
MARPSKTTPGAAAQAAVRALDTVARGGGLAGLTPVLTGTGAAMVIQIANADSPDQMRLAESLSNGLPRRGIAHLALCHMSDAPPVPVVMTKAAAALTKAGAFAGVDRVIVLAQGDQAPAAAALTAGIARGWLLLLGPAQGDLPKGLRGWVIADSFPHRPQPVAGLVALNAIAFGPDVVGALDRSGLLARLVTMAATGDLTPTRFYAMIRARRDLRLYRQNIERLLTARGKADRIPAFVRAFRQRLTRQKAAAEPAVQDQPLPEIAPPAETPAETPARPRTLGNVWHLERRGPALIYLSDQYRGAVMGFEQRGDVTLGQTPDVAIGLVSIGGPGVVRPLPERFDYHLTDENLTPDSPAWGAEAHGAIMLTAARSRHHALHSIIALSAPQSGMMAAEARPDSAFVTALLERIATAARNLSGWGKTLFIDRIRLDLLGGETTLSEDQATALYPRLIAELRHAVAVAAGQISLPVPVVSQAAGSRLDGSAPLILVQGRLEVMNAGLGVIVAAPSYPFRLMPGTVATLDPADQLLIDELECRAIAEVQAGRRWYCPTMRQAFLHGTTLITDWSSLSPLVLDDGPHGFRLEGCDNDARIRTAKVEGSRVVLTLDRAPTGAALAVAYAWGHRRDTADDDRPANHGALRDSFAEPSLMQPGRMLHRHALAVRLPIMPSDL